MEQELMFKEARQRMNAREAGVDARSFNRPSPPRPIRSLSLGSEEDEEGIDGADVYSPSWYKRLGVELGADVEEIKRKYKRLSLIYHPDRSSVSSGDAFVNLRQAYEGLMRLYNVDV